MRLTVLIIGLVYVFVAQHLPCMDAPVDRGFITGMVGLVLICMWLQERSWKKNDY